MRRFELNALFVFMDEERLIHEVERVLFKHHLILLHKSGGSWLEGDHRAAESVCCAMGSVTNVTMEKAVFSPQRLSPRVCIY